LSLLVSCTFWQKYVVVQNRATREGKREKGKMILKAILHKAMIDLRIIPYP
jgi:hypothetical protein